MTLSAFQYRILPASPFVKLEAFANDWTDLLETSLLLAVAFEQWGPIVDKWQVYASTVSS